ncbi:MAG TPA: hypothetical protein PK514_15420 [Spirochaetota bacterium]|nr:hypothetical protein [Spirochaetota bacterium]
MSEYISVIFCRRCGSRYVEVTHWENGNPVATCRTCRYKMELGGFTLGRCGVTKKELEIARNTSAKTNDFEK